MVLQVEIGFVEEVVCHAEVVATEVIETRAGETSEAEDSVGRHSNRGVEGIGGTS